MEYLHSCYSLHPKRMLQTLEQQNECCYLTSDCFTIGRIAARFCCISMLKDSGNTNMKYTLFHVCYKTIYSGPVSRFIFQFDFHYFYPFIFLLYFPQIPPDIKQGWNTNSVVFLAPSFTCLPENFRSQKVFIRIDTLLVETFLSIASFWQEPF